LVSYYKDIKDQVQQKVIYVSSEAAHRSLVAYVNGDFSTTKGIELRCNLRRINRISLSFNYTLSDAKGSGSYPSDRTFLSTIDGSPSIPIHIGTLGYNRTHSGFLNFDYRFRDNDGPILFGDKIFSNFGINLLFSFMSGYHYTRINQYREPNEPLNFSTTPWSFQLDARIDKSFFIGSLEFNIYLWITNLLNTKNILRVFARTGDPIDDGYLTENEVGASMIDNFRINYGEEYAQFLLDFSRAVYSFEDNFGTPRQIRLGIRINY
jgi:hypothetical protein